MIVSDLTAAPDDELGGKGAGLAHLMRLGLPVPPAVVVPVSAQGVLDDPDEVVDRLGEPLAVRSSGLGEDAGDRSAAGQFDTILGVGRAGLADAVRKVVASGASARSTAYIGDETRMAVVIQRLVPASRSGVAFSADPVTGERTVLIECVFGSGEPLVSGMVVPDRYRLVGDRIDARVAHRPGLSGIVRTLRDDEVRTVTELVTAAATGSGRPVDVEFCFEGREPWMLQCRPITTIR